MDITANVKGKNSYIPLEPTAASAGALYDKTGRKIEVGDTLKVFHFIGARRKRYYMYKYVLARKAGNGSKMEYLHISHLSSEGVDNKYYEPCNGRHLEHVEIVQGYRGVPDGLSYEDRPRVIPLNTNLNHE